MSTQRQQPAALPVKRSVRVAWLAVGAVGIVAVAWIVLVFLGPISLPFQKVQATITPQVHVLDRMAQVTGSTTLPDGAVVYCNFAHESTALEGIGGSATVQEGHFSIAKDLSAWPSGRVTLTVEFSIANYGGNEQPPAVVAIFGSEGENLEGPQVYLDSPGDPKELLTSVDFALKDVQVPRSPAVTLAPTGLPPSGGWGHLAVVPPQDGADTARTEGTLRVTDTCVLLDRPGGPVLLVWPADRTSWNPGARTIAFSNFDGTPVSAGDGSRVVLGGSGDSKDESGTTTEAWLARTPWVARPADSCPLDSRW